MSDLRSFAFGASGSTERQGSTFLLHSEAFADCGGLARVRLPEGLQSIGARCFRGTGIRELALPRSVLKIKDSAFAMCRGLGELRVQNGSCLKHVEKRAFFQSCLRTLELNEGLKVVGQECFDGCTTDDVVLPPTVSKLGEDAFDARTNVFVTANSQLVQKCGYVGAQLIYLMESVPQITLEGLRALRGLGEVRLPEGLSVIGHGWFARSGVRRIVIPASVRVIKQYAFAECR